MPSREANCAHCKQSASAARPTADDCLPLIVHGLFSSFQMMDTPESFSVDLPLETRVKLEKMSKDVLRVERENTKLVKYNEDLRQQVELLTAKLYLHQKVDKAVFSSTSSQTDISFDKWVSGCPYCKPQGPSAVPKSEPEKGWTKNGQNATLSVADMVRAAAEETQTSSDYVYDSKTKTYRSRSTGWYYYPDRELFFDPHSKNFFKYDTETKTHKFYSSLSNGSDAPDKKRRKLAKEDIDAMREEREKKLPPKDAALPDDSPGEEPSEKEEEDGEICSSDSDAELSEDCSLPSPPTKEFSLDQVPPVRMIVLESETMDEGSLLLGSCVGSTLGRDSSNIICIGDESVCGQHAEIIFSLDERTYKILDCKSVAGTFQNESYVPEEGSPLRHGDILRLGTCCLLVHIHEGRDVTCIYCEPGCVQARLAQERVSTSKPSESLEVPKNHRQRLKDLKRKYGLDDMDYVVPSNLPKGFNDRAQDRRLKKGSQNPYEKTAQASVHTAIPTTNRGMKMLQKMGWSSGEGLGKDSSGRAEPIAVEARARNAGLGASSSSSTIVASIESQTSRKKQDVWKKTQERYKDLK